jgi:uncharacterized protein YodC (DUF2158 family)
VEEKIEKFQLGDLVKLRSGGPIMCVAEVRYDGVIHARWFDDEQVIHDNWFRPQELLKVS